MEIGLSLGTAKPYYETNWPRLGTWISDLLGRHACSGKGKVQVGQDVGEYSKWATYIVSLTLWNHSQYLWHCR